MSGRVLLLAEPPAESSLDNINFSIFIVPFRTVLIFPGREAELKTDFLLVNSLCLSCSFSGSLRIDRLIKDRPYNRWIFFKNHQLF